jgi:hypothetical protein
MKELLVEASVFHHLSAPNSEVDRKASQLRGVGHRQYLIALCFVRSMAAPGATRTSRDLRFHVALGAWRTSWFDLTDLRVHGLASGLSEDFDGSVLPQFGDVTPVLL